MEPDKGDDDKKQYLIQQPSRATETTVRHLSDDSPPPRIPQDSTETQPGPVSPMFNDSNVIEVQEPSFPIQDSNNKTHMDDNYRTPTLMDDNYI